MPKETTIRCDCGCKQVRLQSNNWIQAQIDVESFRSWKWDDKRVNRKRILFLAGEDCAHKMYSQWLAGRLHKPQTVDIKPFVYEEVGGNENQSALQVEEAVGR